MANYVYKSGKSSKTAKRAASNAVTERSKRDDGTKSPNK